MGIYLGRLYPVLLGLWRFLILSVFLSVVMSLLSAGISGAPWEPTLTVRQFVGTHLIWPIEAFLVLLLITTLSYEDWRELIDNRLLNLATVKRVSELKPGLKSESADIAIANFQPDTYLDRDVDHEASQTLENNGCLIVIGRPRSGKTRAAFEQFRNSPDALVVMPREDKPAEFRAEGLQGKELILFIDDLHLVAPTMDLNGWINRLKNANPRSLRIVCTARDGADWSRVEEHQGKFLQSFDPSSRVHISRGARQGADYTLEEGKRLAEMLNLEISDEEFDQRFDGTPGSLTLHLEDMGDRYDSLRQKQIGGVSASLLINSIKLLHHGGQARLRRDIVRTVAESIRGNAALSNETWEALERDTEEEGFGVFEQGTFRTYRPYLENPACISYEPSPEEIAALVPLLTQHRDFEGLFYFGAELQHQDNQPLAKQAYEAAAGDFGWAANNLGTMLMEEGKFAEAEDALNKAIALGADLAYGNLGKLLSDHTNRAQEAENAFREGAARGIANASFGLGHHLAKQPGREADAETAYREAIERGDNRALLNLGNLLMTIPGRRSEVEQLFRDAIAAGVVEAYNSLGTFLLEEGNRADAEVAYRTGAENGFALCSYNLAEMLADDPERWTEVEQSYRDAIAAGASGSQLRLGVRLSEQPGKELVAAAELEKAIDAGEIDADGYLRLGTVLMRIPGRGEAAEAALRSAMNAGDREAINRLGILIANLRGREAQAEVILTTATVVAPQVAHRNLGVLLARQDGRERDAETAFLAAIAAGDVRGYLDLGMLLLRSPRRSVEACTALQRAAAAEISEASLLFQERCI